MIRIRHPFVVRAIDPQLSFAGTPHQIDTGDKTVRLEADHGVGIMTLIVSSREAPQFRLGALMTIEVIGPDPLGRLYDLEVGPPGTVVSSEDVRRAIFDVARNLRTALGEIPDRLAERLVGKDAETIRQAVSAEMLEALTKALP